MTTTILTPQQFIAQTIHARRAGERINPCRHPKTYQPYPITTAYGIPGDEWQCGHHTGEDHACPVGSLAIAPTWGHVIGTGVSALGWGQAYGLMVVVRQANGAHDYAFCHLSAVRVRVGQQVEPGLVVGLTGDSGHVTGPHLHFEVRPPGGRYGSDVHPITVERRPLGRRHGSQ